MEKSSKGPINQPKLTNFFGSNPSSHSEKKNGSEVVVSNVTNIDVNKTTKPSSSTTKICASTGVKPKTNIAVRPVRCPTDLSPMGSTRPIMTSQSLKGLALPKSQIDNRRFQPTWLDKFNWLEYSVSHDAAFCFPCRCFKLKSVKEPVFTESGFSSWKSALVQNKGFKRHESSPGHVEAMCSWQEKLLRDANENPVTELLVSNTLQKRRFYMKAVIEALLFLITNELAIRGNWDSAEHREDGIFCNLFEFMMKDNEELRKCQAVMPKNATYMSPEIQNELIGIITKLTKEHNVEEINSADVEYLTILSDGTKDRNYKECVSIAIRYVFQGKPREKLLSFETTKQFDAKTNADLILSTLKNYGLAFTKILSQCYDGANVMSGDDGGIQRIIQEKLGRIIPYVHCFNHKLHLVVIAALESIGLANNFFDTIMLIYNFFRRSKVQAFYQGSSILKLIITRWAGHNRATNAIFNNYSEVIDALSQVKRNKECKFDGEDLALASGIMSTIQKLNFLFMLVFMKEFLNTIAPADKILQSRDIGFREAMPVIRDVLSKIVQLRNQESFDRILESAKNMMPEVSLDKILEGAENVMPKEDILVNQARPTRNKQRPVGLRDFILTERIGERNAEPLIEIKSAYFEIIDVFKSEFTRRFEENEEILLAISEAGEFSLEKLQPLRQLGLELPSAEELAVAKSYIDRKRTEYETKRRENKDTKFKTRFNLLEQLYVMRDVFPNVYKLMAAVDTFGCSTTVCECSFSALDRVGTKPRISMGNERLRNLSFLAFEHKTVAQISTDEILKKFNANPQRRIQLY